MVTQAVGNGESHEGAGNDMSGLRDQQKKKRREAILAASAGLFGKQGYAATSMEEIATAAELSVGTLYNYFKSKGDITLALYRADLEMVRKASEAVILEPSVDPVKAIIKLMEADLNTTPDYLDGNAWQELLVAAFTSPSSSMAVEWEGGDLMRVDLFSRLLGALQERGHIGEQADIRSVAEVLGALSLTYFMHWLVNLKAGRIDQDSCPIAGPTKRMLTRQVKQLVAGMVA
ncbi:MAG: TetR/AcrR family transcriptional regulator [Rhodospirillaceae bacterium]|nr:MAG: TetR/AcrR family transcriptional regulator [Rhodospirillaceae bacterium]